MQLLAQSKISKVIAAQKIDWYGLDFSRAKMIGPEGFRNPDAPVIKIHYGWNNTTKSESSKYDPGKFIGKTANIDFDVCNARNKKITEEGLVINEEYHLLPKDIQEIVNEYPKKIDGNIGLVFIKEAFNKTEEKGYIWVTFFDEKTGQVLVTERVPGNASGFGFRNYWLGAVYNVLKNTKKLYKEWVKDFG